MDERTCVVCVESGGSETAVNPRMESAPCAYLHGDITARENAHINPMTAGAARDPGLHSSRSKG